MNSPVRLAILAALPREVHALVRGERPEPSLQREGIFLYRLDGAVVVAAGMGAARVSLAFEAALATGAVESVISAGLAGACSAALAAGTVAEAAVVVDSRTGERFGAIGTEGQTLVTTEAIAGVAEKARLATSYDAAMVDMEAATVARLAQAHGLRFRAIKGISDALDFELASLAGFSGPHGQFRTGAFALHTALRPHRWGAAMRLGRNSGRALEALHARLREIVTHGS